MNSKAITFIAMVAALALAGFVAGTLLTVQPAHAVGACTFIQVGGGTTTPSGRTSAHFTAHIACS